MVNFLSASPFAAATCSPRFLRYVACDARLNAFLWASIFAFALVGLKPELSHGAGFGAEYGALASSSDASDWVSSISSSARYCSPAGPPYGDPGECILSIAKCAARVEAVGRTLGATPTLESVSAIEQERARAYGGLIGRAVNNNAVGRRGRQS